MQIYSATSPENPILHIVDYGDGFICLVTHDNAAAASNAVYADLRSFFGDRIVAQESGRILDPLCDFGELMLKAYVERDKAAKAYTLEQLQVIDDANPKPRGTYITIEAPIYQVTLALSQGGYDLDDFDAIFPEPDLRMGRV